MRYTRHPVADAATLFATTSKKQKGTRYNLKSVPFFVFRQHPYLYL